jgi:cytochrome P450
MGPLVLGVLPSILARTAYQARKKVQAALLPYYAAELDQRDPLASEFVRARSRLFRTYDLPTDELARNEVSIMLAATTNTVPTLFWFVANVWLRPDVVADLRAEVAPALSMATTPAGAPHTATVHAARLETACPLLASCYRESVRLASQIITFRRVLADTRITDGAGGSYLLKAGNDVMMPAKVVHRHRPTWGADADAFDPRRFVPPAEATNDTAQRQRKAAFVPFGGGKHLCPGRHFAFAENLAIMAALLSGFEIRGLRAERLRMRDSKMGEAAKPAAGFEGGPVVMARRAGWEEVVWKFVC